MILADYWQNLIPSNVHVLSASYLPGLLEDLRETPTRLRCGACSKKAY